MSRAGGVSIGISADTSEAKSDVAAFLAEIQSKPVTIPITFANPNGNPNAPTTASAAASGASAASGGSTPLSFDTTGLKRQIDEVRAYAVQQFAGIPIGQTASSSSAAVAASAEARQRTPRTPNKTLATSDVRNIFGDEAADYFESSEPVTSYRSARDDGKIGRTVRARRYQLREQNYEADAQTAGRTRKTEGAVNQDYTDPALSTQIDSLAESIFGNAKQQEETAQSAQRQREQESLAFRSTAGRRAALQDYASEYDAGEVARKRQTAAAIGQDYADPRTAKAVDQITESIFSQAKNQEVADKETAKKAEILRKQTDSYRDTFYKTSEHLRNQDEAEKETVSKIRGQTELIGRSREERLGILQERLDNAEPDTVEAAQLEQQVARTAQEPQGATGGGRDQFGRLRRIATLGFAAYEALRVGRDVQQYDTNFALAEGNAPRQAQLSRQFADTIGNFPIVGQAAALISDLPGVASFFGSSSPFDLAKASFGADESLKDVGARGERLSGYFAAQASAVSARRQAEVPSFRGSIRRQDQTLVNQFSDAQDARTLQEQDLQIKIAEATDPYEQSRLRQAHTQLIRDNIVRDTAEGDRLVANRTELARTAELRVNAQRRQNPEITAEAEGSTAIASRRRFLRTLRDSEVEADEFSPELGRVVRSQNVLREEGFREQIREQVRGVQSSTRGLQFSLERNPVARQLEEQGELFRRQLKEQVSDDPVLASRQRIAFSENNSKTIDLINQRENDKTSLDIFGLRSQREVSAILANPNLGPTAGPISQVDQIKRQAQGRVFSEFLSDSVRAAKESPEIYASARQQLQSFGQEYVRGFQATEVDLNRTDTSGAGSENPSDILKSIRDAIKALENAPKTLIDIKNALGNLVATD